MKSTICLVIVLLGAGCDDGTADPSDARVSGGDDASVAAADASPDAAPNNPDDVDYSCDDPGWSAAACAPGAGVNDPDRGNQHVGDEQPIEYVDPVPASGNHRGSWARWGEYTFLPAQRWLHNLEHGGAAFLYHPCAAPETIDALREVARAQVDADGPFRWVMTPYPDLPTAVAVVTWTWRFEAPCVDAAEITAFVERTYRQAPEDVPSDGAYQEGWTGR